MKRFERSGLFLCLCTLLAAPLFLAGCGGAPVPAPVEEPLVPDSGALVPVAKAPQVQRAAALSRHYVEVVFDGPVGAEALDPSVYIITGPASAVLPVMAVRIIGDGSHVLLTTGEQGDFDYELKLNTAHEAVSKRTRAALLAPNAAVVFKGSTQAEPYVASAIALSPYSVLVSYNGVMDNNVQVIEYYEIADPDLDVIDAVIGSTKTTALLTTSTQENIDYTLRVTNVTSNNGTKLIDPTRSTVTFNGIAPAEPPIVTGAVATSATTILVSFNKPLADDAADPIHFSISPSLVVATAKMSLYNTQVELKTLPMSAGETYTVTATDIKDRGGNLIGGPPDNEATFTFLGTPETGGGTNRNDLPRVIGAASTSNTSVVVTFNKPMGDSALLTSSYWIVQENVNGEVGTLFILGPQKIVDGGDGVVDSTALDDDVQAALAVVAPGEAVVTAGPDLALDSLPGGDDLIVGSPRFTGPDRTAVELTTTSQNEVTYRVTVVNARDLAGNHLAPKELLVDPTTAVFPGTPPSTAPDGSAGEAVDTDGDGIPDHRELRGYLVTVRLTSGDIITREVTSNPLLFDTDADGLPDGDELSLSTDPRAFDTDGDLVSDAEEFNVWFTEPTDQDTDTDGLVDWIEMRFYKSSPLLADTDGDGLDDSQELTDFNRDPRVADLPTPRIKVGDIRLQLDERFTFNDERGEEVSVQTNSQTTLQQANDQKFSTSDTEVTKSEWEIGGKFGAEAEISKDPKLTLSLEVSGKYSRSNEHTSQVSLESTVHSEETFEESLNKGQTLTTSSSVQRELAGARVDAAVQIDNVGDIAFSLENLSLTMLQQDRRDRTRFLPVATLQPGTGEETVFNLGPLLPERGPVLFSNSEVFPNLVQDLMKDPRGLITKVANFDIIDEFGRNFAFASQEANDKTAGIVIDYGDGRSERFRVALAGGLDLAGVFPSQCSADSPDFGSPCLSDGDCAGVNGKGTCGPAFVGGFDDEGRIVGLPLDYILQDILKLKKNATDSDAVVAGDDEIAQSVAQGDDVQLVPAGTRGLEKRTIVIAAGQNGVLDTPADAADEEAVTTGFETSRFCSATSIDAGDVCSADSDCAGGFCGPETLVRVGNSRNRDISDPSEGDDFRFWVAMTPSQIPFGGNFGEVVLKPRDVLLLAYVQDLDEDGLFARQEFLYGSSDKDTNTDGGNQEPEVIYAGANGLANTLALGDDIQIVAITTVFKPEDLNPRRPIISAGANGKIDSVPGDSDGDGISNGGDDVLGVEMSEAVYEPGGIREPGAGNGFANTLAREDDIQAVPVGAPAGPNEVIILAGPNGVLDSVANDSNGDGVADGGDDVIDPDGNGTVETEAKFDDIQVIAVGEQVLPGMAVVLAGPNGIIDATPAGGETIGAIKEDLDDFAEIRIGWQAPIVGFDLLHVYPDPRRADSDADGLLDDVEKGYRTDPKARDTDGDQISDTTEINGFLIGLGITPGVDGVVDTRAEGDDIQAIREGTAGVPAGEKAILPGPNGVVDTTPEGDDQLTDGELRITDPLDPDTDGDSLTDGLERALGSDPLNALDGDTVRDSDEDGLTDREEILGYSIPALGIAKVTSDPTRGDTDDDGLPDLLEAILVTDPRSEDGDKDGLSDFDEVADLERYLDLNFAFHGFTLDTFGARNIGTDPTDADSDNDTLNDGFEVNVGWRVLLAGDDGVRKVFPDPLFDDTDADGLKDNAEFFKKTDPTNPDTDGDGRYDGIEDPPTDPLVPDALVSVNFADLRLQAGNGANDGPNGLAEWGWNFRIRGPGSTLRIVQNAPPCYSERNLPGNTFIRVNASSVKFRMVPGDVIFIEGEVFESDNCVPLPGDGNFCLVSSDHADKDPHCISGSFIMRFSKAVGFEDLAVGQAGGSSGPRFISETMEMETLITELDQFDENAPPSGRIDIRILIDSEDPDLDGDGVLNGVDSDVDGDGIPNSSDPDVDNDGVPNGADDDIDSDGFPNHQDSDMDGDGAANGADGDVDGDGLDNDEDPDVDADGIPNGSDDNVDGDTLPNGTDNDVDGDGTLNGSDTDVDGDGLLNGADNDIDGDGVPNRILPGQENTGTLDPDMDGDGLLNSDNAETDIDGDGLADNAAGELDIDADGIPDEDDPDIDADGVLNTADSDMDGDGVANTADFDDMDGDGLANGDGSDADIDADGIPNSVDSDMDGDGTPNATDPDVDGDGLANNSAAETDIDADGTPDGNDPDIDGDGEANTSDSDMDGDGVANTADFDDMDGDGLTNGGGLVPADPDIDGDGIVNGADSDLDGDGTENEDDPDVDGDGLSNDSVLEIDIDGDGILDDLDGDIDGDGILNGPDLDMDGDGDPDASDPDKDGDGVLNLFDGTPDGVV